MEADWHASFMFGEPSFSKIQSEKARDASERPRWAHKRGSPNKPL